MPRGTTGPGSRREPRSRQDADGVEPELVVGLAVALADSGTVDADAFDRLKADGIEPYVPPSRAAAGQRRRHDFRPASERPEKPLRDPRRVAMRVKLQTAAGRALYAKRRKTSEPVFGIIKQAMGFRRFLLRGLQMVNAEWLLVCLAYNVRRLFALATA